MESLPLLILIALALVVFVVLPQRQRKNMAAKQQAMRESMLPGTRVMTTSGMYASVVSVTDTSVDLEIAPGVVTTWLLAAVREVVPAEAAAESPTETGGATGTTGFDGTGDTPDSTR
ncbi:preprotein translocase subunit YajC [Modestobacter sp. NPDC049651]|uniref:preprotein translocase subunit YajC n=1 Tax=unclassified Modestobacter TaxID=2643866 RepID=UPI0033DC6943